MEPNEKDAAAMYIMVLKEKYELAMERITFQNEKALLTQERDAVQKEKAALEVERTAFRNLFRSRGSS